MKTRIYILAAMLVATIFTSLAQNPGGVMLSSNGQIRTYSSDRLVDAINAANPGDTIYLGKGGYGLGNLPTAQMSDGNTVAVLSKPLTIIGVGGNDQIDTHTTLSFNYDPYIDLSSASGNFSLEGICIYNYIRLNPGQNKVAIRNALTYGIVVEGSGGGLEIDRCNISELNLGNGLLAEAQVKNSLITSQFRGCVAPGETMASFNHCYIASVYGDDQLPVKGNIINSYIQYLFGDEVSYENCYYQYGNGDISNVPMQNCTNIDGSIDINSLNLDRAASESFGFYGNDGTVAGVMGGSSPYTLSASYPTPDYENSSVTYDSVNKKLNIKVKVLTD